MIKELFKKIEDGLRGTKIENLILKRHILHNISFKMIYQNKEISLMYKW